MEQFKYKDHSSLDNGVGYIFIRAVTDFMSPKDFESKVVAVAHKNDGNIEVDLTINGVSVPIVKVFQSVWDSLKAQNDEDVRKAAVKLITESKLYKLLQTLEHAEWKIEQEINKLGLGE